jgi:uncharacterized protein YaaN involved in tellurite resistance
MNPENASVSTKSTENAIIPFDMAQTHMQIRQKAKDTRKIDAITNQINISDTNTIVTFGKEAAEGIARCSDIVLKNVEMDRINQTSALMKSLATIMDKFDPKELTEEKKGPLAKLLGRAKEQLQNILDKYNTMGAEVEKIFVELKQYENQIANSNKTLESLFQENIDFFQSLTDYILAGEDGCKQIDEHRDKMQAQFDETGDLTLQFQIQSLVQGKEMLEQRIHDLRIAENVAVQSIPMLKAMQFTNFNLARKINSAFIITLPVFKQALAQAVLLKQQKMQSDALAELDKKTNEMLIRNAQNTMNQTAMTARLVSESSIKIETLEQTYQTIMNGISEILKIQEEASRKRDDEKIRLEQLKLEMIEKKSLK